MEDFHVFINHYLAKWKAADVEFIENLIDDTFQGMEVRDGSISSYGKESSVTGWKQAFAYFKDKKMEWVLTPISILPLNEKDIMAIIKATMTLDGKLIKTSNLFFQTFTMKNGKWRLIRSYEETGVTNL
ncbi:flavoprotein [Terribacillus sp. DMT04]|uniref:flavoprotein n=1 Tax=Terribacillus sp. DMT04 TaxID=2850441 RepID=UPI001C2CB7E2|nr:flavoprotein [Terribacillus sp. DMT04]QXE02835.1 flavoprotein [Terribacillus sp. DMT04]